MTSAALLASALGARAAEVEGVRPAMGAPFSVRLYGPSEPALRDLRERIFARVEELDQRLSSFRRDSEITRVNLEAPRPVKVSPDALACVALALDAWRRTGGAFNPLVGAVMKARRRLPAFGSPGPEDAGLLDAGAVELDAAASTIRLPRPGMWLDLGGVGKGFALREAEAVASGHADGAAFDFGGQLHFAGRRPRTASWPAAVADPRSGARVWSGLAGEGSLSTSAQTDKPGHIVDPRGGWPRAGARAEPAGRVSATVWARDPAWADALSTAIFLMGVEEARAVLKALDARAFVIDEGGGRWIGGPPPKGSRH